MTRESDQHGEQLETETVPAGCEGGGVGGWGGGGVGGVGGGGGLFMGNG